MWRAACLSIILACVASASSPSFPNKLVVLAVFDTGDAELGPGLKADLARLEKALRGTVRNTAITFTSFTGRDLTPEGLVARLRELRTKVGPRDTVLLYYGGRGAVVDKIGHVLRLPGGKDMPRKDVRRELLGCKAGLTVLLTDCRSIREKTTLARHDFVLPRCTGHLASHLLSRERGVVDVTSAADEQGWADDLDGGLMTRLFCRLLVDDDVKGIDVNGDGYVTWNEFLPRLQRETRSYFGGWPDKMRARYPDAPSRAEARSPHAFFLGKQSAYAVVELENARATPFKYRHRWEGKAEWSEAVLKPGDRKSHLTLFRDGKDMPRLEISREGAAKDDFLAPTKWEEDRFPRDLPTRFRIKK